MAKLEASNIAQILPEAVPTLGKAKLVYCLNISANVVQQWQIQFHYGSIYLHDFYLKVLENWNHKIERAPQCSTH